jgi:hypothetical protein
MIQACYNSEQFHFSTTLPEGNSFPSGLQAEGGVPRKVLFEIKQGTTREE